MQISKGMPSLEPHSRKPCAAWVHPQKDSETLWPWKKNQSLEDDIPQGGWFKHILFMTEHDKGLGRAKKLCLALSKRRLTITTRRLTIIDIVINVAMYMAGSWVLLIDQEGIKISKVNFIAFMNLHCFYVVIVMMHWYEMWRQICRSNVTKCFKFKGHWHFKWKCLQKACNSEGCGLKITIPLCHVDPWTRQLSPPSEVTMNDKSNNANAVFITINSTYIAANKSAQAWWNLSGLSDNLPETLNSAIRKSSSSSWKSSSSFWIRLMSHLSLA